VDGYIAFGVAEYRLFYWALLQKRPMIVRSLLWEAKWMGTLHLELQNIVSFKGSFAKETYYYNIICGGRLSGWVHCIWSVTQSQFRITISLVSFEENVTKETQRTGFTIEI